MLTLTRAKRSSLGAGDPLPTVFNVLAANSVHIRQGQLCLIAAAPGVGKSLISLSIALRSQVPTFYASADSDEFTMYVRAAAMLTGWTVDECEAAIRGDEVGKRTIDAALDAASHIRWSFEPTIDFNDLEEHLEAFAATYGEWPKLIVVDNLKDLAHPEGEGTLADTCKYLKVVARVTGAAVIALHHVTGEYDDGNKPVPLSGLMEKVSKIPEVILTLDRNPQAVTFDGRQHMFVRPVKVRGGRADPSGAWGLPISATMERMKLEG